MVNKDVDHIAVEFTAFLFKQLTLGVSLPEPHLDARCPTHRASGSEARIERYNGGATQQSHFTSFKTLSGNDVWFPPLEQTFLQ